MEPPVGGGLRRRRTIKKKRRVSRRYVVFLLQLRCWSSFIVDKICFVSQVVSFRVKTTLPKMPKLGAQVCSDLACFFAPCSCSTSIQRIISETGCRYRHAEHFYIMFDWLKGMLKIISYKKSRLFAVFLQMHVSSSSWLTFPFLVFSSLIINNLCLCSQMSSMLTWSLFFPPQSSDKMPIVEEVVELQDLNPAQVKKIILINR